MRLFVQHLDDSGSLPRRSEIENAQAVVGVGSDNRPVFLIVNSEAGATFLMTREDDRFDEVALQYLTKEQRRELGT